MATANGSFASSDPFQLLFELSDSPAAVCDSALSLLACNPPFERLCGQRPVGQRLDSIFTVGPLTAPEPGHCAEATARTPSGEVVRLVVSAVGQAFAVAVRSLAADSERNGNGAPLERKGNGAPIGTPLKVSQPDSAQAGEWGAIKDLERRIIQAEKLASLGQFAASVV
ncbi:MAG TPA: hypothetical protein VKE49_13130, partial [Myxococcaceae bacterium]|nr:hypothetical protein [Myxococcaceae bacterium]